MNKKLKYYQLKKLKYYLKKTNLIFFFYITNLNIKNQLKLEQKLSENNFKIYKTKNTITKHLFKKSIFLNFLPLIKGPLCIIVLKNNEKLNINFQTLLNLNLIVPVLTIKLNKKIYNNSQLKTISTLNYKSNITILNKTLKSLLKTPYYKLKILNSK